MKQTLSDADRVTEEVAYEVMILLEGRQYVSEKSQVGGIELVG